MFDQIMMNKEGVIQTCYRYNITCSRVCNKGGVNKKCIFTFIVTTRGERVVNVVFVVVFIELFKFLKCQ